MKKNIYFERERFQKINAWCKENGVTPQYSKIRLSRKLQDGVGEYEFSLDEKRMELSVGDVALNRNDLFIPMDLGMFLQLDTKTPTGKASLLSFPLGMNGYSVGFQNVEDVETIYNGRLVVVMNQIQANQSFPCEVFRHVPQGFKQDRLDKTPPPFDLAETMLPLAPEYYFQGTVDTSISLKFNGHGCSFALYDKGTDGANTTHSARVVLLMTGVLIKNFAEKGKEIAELLN